MIPLGSPGLGTAPQGALRSLEPTQLPEHHTCWREGSSYASHRLVSPDLKTLACWMSAHRRSDRSPSCGRWGPVAPCLLMEGEQQLRCFPLSADLGHLLSLSSTKNVASSIKTDLLPLLTLLPSDNHSSLGIGLEQDVQHSFSSQKVQDCENLRFAKLLPGYSVPTADILVHSYAQPCYPL